MQRSVCARCGQGGAVEPRRGCSGRNGKGGDDGERRPSKTRMLMLPVLNQEQHGEKAIGSGALDSLADGVLELSVTKQVLHFLRAALFFGDTARGARTRQDSERGCSCDGRRRCCDLSAEGGRRRGGGFYAS